MSYIIKVENLSKKYIIAHQKEERYTALRDVITQNIQHLGKRFRHPFLYINDTKTNEEFWALKNINFEIKQGDRVGVIGRNGAGKSTLLKILSRITEPTTGRFTLKGRVASLLEVGTGFHPELTGRENIFLNGAILGMGKKEIKRKFCEIVQFAEVEKFLDTPVKRYSSGMYVRLTFAIAAHLESEILLVDEVLAVGDAQFQKKCLGKMEDIGKEGRTILFVSHNLATIQAVCNSSILLQSGNITKQGDTPSVIQEYTKSLVKTDVQEPNIRNRIAVRSLDIISKDSVITSKSSIEIKINLFTPVKLPQCYLNLVIEDTEGNTIVHNRTDMYNIFPIFEPGIHNLQVKIAEIGLRSGIYSVWFRLYCNSKETYECVDSERVILIIEGKQISGLVDIPCQWKW